MSAALPNLGATMTTERVCPECGRHFPPSSTDTAQSGLPNGLRPGHPRAVSLKYVFEHILVVEELLSRYLWPDERIHHRNGVKDDNRPENLELWTRPQPSGIRVSDALEWARTILSRYEGLGTPPTMLTARDMT